MSNTNNEREIGVDVKAVDEAVALEVTENTPSNLVEDIEVTIEGILPTEVEQMISKYSFSFDGSSMVISDDIKEQSKDAQNVFQEMQKQGTQLTDLDNTISHYLDGLKILSEEIDNDEDDENSLYSKYLLPTLNRAKRLKFIGKPLRGLINEAAKFDRSIMEDLGNGGLDEITIKSEKLINQVNSQHETLVSSKNSIISVIDNLNIDLEKVTKFSSYEDLNESDIISLLRIKENIEGQLIINDSLLNISIDGIKFYQINIIGLTQSIPTSIQTLSSSLVSYGILETGKKVGDVNDKLIKASVDASVSSAKLLDQSSRALKKRLELPSTHEQIAEKVLPHIQNVFGRNMEIEDKSNKRGRPVNKSLELLSNLNKQRENN